MEEAHLGVESFSPVRQLELALREMGYSTERMDALAGVMKEEPMRVAGQVCQRMYNVDRETSLLSVLDEILNEFLRNGLIDSEPRQAWEDDTEDEEDQRTRLQTARSRIKEDDEMFPTIINRLFTSQAEFRQAAANSSGILCSQRGSRSKVLMLKSVAASALWRVLMGGAPAAAEEEAAPAGAAPAAEGSAPAAEGAAPAAAETAEGAASRPRRRGDPRPGQDDDDDQED